MGVPKGIRKFKVRPVVGVQGSGTTGQINCGTDVFSASGGNSVCVDSPHAPPLQDIVVKIKH